MIFGQKKEVAEIEKVEHDEALNKGAAVQRDYSGASKKTDPREIALVRKLDMWIMPVLWLMYWLNYLVS